MKKNNIKILLTSTLTCFAVASSAMTFPPKPPQPPPSGHHDAPFDGGISLLVAAGVAYGVKRAYKNKN